MVFRNKELSEIKSGQDCGGSWLFVDAPCIGLSALWVFGGWVPGPSAQAGICRAFSAYDRGRRSQPGNSIKELSVVCGLWLSTVVG